MANPTKKIFIISGEVSGDLHAANLVSALKNHFASLEVYAMGSKKLQATGATMVQDIKDISVVGVFDVLKNIGKIKKAFNNVLSQIQSIKPDGVIFVDYPGFNLRLAQKVKTLGIKTFYYVSPQIWAWGKGRIKVIKKSIDHMIVFFDFEKNMYDKAGVDVFFCGHPLLDETSTTGTITELKFKNGLDTKKKTIGFFPGSRPSEIKSLFAELVKSADILYAHYDANVQFIVQKSPIIDKAVYLDFLSNKPYIKLVDNSIYDNFSVCDFSVVCSGTATLEAAIMGAPMIIIYKVSKISWFLFRHLVKIDNIGLCNVVAGKKIVPELLQEKVNANDITKEIINILENKPRLDKIKHDLLDVKNKLGHEGATERAAQYIAYKL